MPIKKAKVSASSVLEQTFLNHCWNELVDPTEELFQQYKTALADMSAKELAAFIADYTIQSPGANLRKATVRNIVDYLMGRSTHSAEQGGNPDYVSWVVIARHSILREAVKQLQARKVLEASDRLVNVLTPAAEKAVQRLQDDDFTNKPENSANQRELVKQAITAAKESSIRLAGRPGGRQLSVKTDGAATVVFQDVQVPDQPAPVVRETNES